MEGGGREAVLRAYDELLLTHPELPRQLRDFQVDRATYWGLLFHNFWGVYKYQDTGEQFPLNEYIPDSS